MVADKRQRGIRGHATAEDKPMEIDWASPKQEEAFRYGPWPILASGGYGSSKTFAFCLKALWLSDVFKNNRGVIARKYGVDLRTTTRTTFYKICPPKAYNRGGRRADSENILQLNNGSTILWLHLDDPETENVIRGLEINWFFIDQAEEVEEEIFDHLSARLGRWDQSEVPDWMIKANGGLDAWAWKNPVTGKALVPTYAMMACNPDTELHWLWRRFHPESPDWQRKYKGLGYKMIQMDSRENKYLSRQNLEAMMEKDEAFVRRFVYGQWGIPEGQIHSIDDSSIIEGNDEILHYIRQSCTLHRVLDHGDASPTCCLWFAVDREGNVIFYREYYEPNKLVSEHRRNIAELSEYESYEFQLADPSIFFLTQQKHGGRWSTADEYKDCVNLPKNTAIFWQPADNNELGTRNRINEYLRVVPDRIHPFTKQKGAPRLFFIERGKDYPHGCSHVIRETKAQRREKIGTEDGRPIFSDERDKTLTDHAYDCVRYALASRPPISHELAARIGRMTFDAVRAEYKRMKHRGGLRKLAKEAIA